MKILRIFVSALVGPSVMTLAISVADLAARRPFDLLCFFKFVRDIWLVKTIYMGDIVVVVATTVLLISSPILISVGLYQFIKNQK